MRRMLANLHVTNECKRELDLVIPAKISDKKVTYDDALMAILYFLKDTLNYNQHDIIEMIISYEQHKLELAVLA